MIGWIWRILVWFLVAKFAAWVAFFGSIWAGARLGEAIPALDPLVPWVIAGSWPGTLVVVLFAQVYWYVARTDRARARRQVVRVPGAYTHSGGRVHGSSTR